MSLGGSKAPGFRAEEQHDSSRLQIRWQCGKAHAHRFRDTFAVELLLAGVPIERVSILLGHQSVRITEKHYAPWVRSRQEQLEADLANAWSRDPLVLLQSGVHQRYTERSGPTTRSSSIRKSGARGGSRTHMRKNPRRILSPQRLPFRHPGKAEINRVNVGHSQQIELL